MKKYKIGYTQGVFDMFHIGHLNLLRNAKKQCDYLIVGVNSNDLVKQYKNKTTVVDESQRCDIVSNIKCVDECFVVDTLNKVDAVKRFNYNAIFIGDDWKDSPRWQQTIIDLAPYNAEVVFLPRTTGISSTVLRPQKDNAVSDK